MDLTKRARFTTDCYGGKPYLTGDQVVKNWLESQKDNLLHSRFQPIKKALTNDKKMEQILSVLNVDGDNCPGIGNWMFFECSINAVKVAGTWANFTVSKEIWINSVIFSPVISNFYNGRKITSPEFVEIYPVSPRGKTPFFKAYQGIRAGAEFEFTISFPEDLCSKIEGKGKDKVISADTEKTLECVNTVLDKMCKVGLGAFRRRFGKFEYIK